MKKRLLSWLLVLSMVISLIPSTLVTALAADLPSAQASGQAGKTKVETTLWPSDLNADITDFRVTGTIIPGDTLTVKKGKTLIVHGNGTLSGTGRAQQTPFFIVEDGGHLVLDNVTVTLNKSDSGTVVVQKGGLLDLGYNDQKDRFAPSITGNTTASGAAKNLVIADGATVRLNAAADKAIGVSCTTDVLNTTPKSLIQGGRYALTNQDIASGKITTDDSRFALALAYDQLFIRSAKPRMLFWDQTSYFDWHTFKTENRVVDASLNDLQVPAFREAGAEVVSYAGSRGNPKRIDASTNILGYDIIFLCTPDTSLIQAERALLLDYLNNGGRIVLQGEDASAHTNFGDMNTNASSIAQSLGGGFTIMASPAIEWLASMAYKETHKLTEGINVPSINWKVGAASPIKVLYPDEASTLFWGYANNNSAQPFVVDQRAGNKNGAKWGNVTVMSDANMWGASGAGTAGTYSRTFAQNLLNDSRSNRLSAAAGYNPNDTFSAWEATTTTPTPYRTPYAALQKAVEGNTVTLLTNSRAADGGLTPTRDELLFEKSTLAYETGSQYDGSKIYADKAGVYLDITKTGEVNLRSGTVTVTPNSATYPLVLNGTMDQAGTQITGGYKITSTGAYTLDADDDTTKIKPGNGGGASITIPKAGTSVTVAYTGGTDGKLNGKTITYTATEDNEKFYLGCYTVSYEVEGNVTWTETDLAWDGHNFETKMTPAPGYDAHGEKLAVVDIKNAKTYDMENGGTEGTGTETWGVFNSKTMLKDGTTPKITVKQQYLHENNVDRNGYATVTVRNVREDITIRTTGNAVESSRPNIYVVGVGVKDGQRTQLWAYTTQRTTDDQNITKDVEGWPWAKWKVVSAKTAKGTQAAYEGNQITTWTGQTIKNSTTAGGALCPVELIHGDMVVEFEYEWDMVNVKINAKLGEGGTAVDFPGYTTQYAEVQRDVESTIYAPNLSGYQSTAASTTITPTKGTDGNYGPYEVTFHYKLAMGQVLYRAVDADGHELATWEGPRVSPGDAVSTDYALAPKLAGYQVKQQNGTATAVNGGPTDKYDGINQITVTWVYEPKTRDVEIRMVEYKASGDHCGAELRTDTTSYARSPVGFTLNLTAPAIPGYTVKEVENDDEISKSKSVFVEDNESAKLTVYFYYEVNTQDDAKITVQLWDKVNDEEIWSYTVPGQNGEKQLVRVPTVKGYVSDPSNKDTSIAPDETINKVWGKGTVRFLYSPNTVKVTVKLVDSTKTAGDQGYELNSKLPNYRGEYTVVKGERVDIVAPDVYGYTLKDTTKSVYTVTVDPNETRTEIVETIEYVPISNQMVNIKVTGTVDGGGDLYTYTVQVAAGSGTYTIDAKKSITGYTLTSAKIASAEKINEITADGKLAVPIPDDAKGGTVPVTLTYKSTKTTVTVKAMCGQEDLNTSYTVEKEIGVKDSVYAPTVPGYTATASSKEVTPNGNDEVIFQYTKNTGNVVLIAKANGVELFRQDGRTKTKGDTINANDFTAPVVTYYQRTATEPTITVNGQAFATGGQYDGSGQIEITYEYQRKTTSVTIVKKDDDTKRVIDRTQVIPNVDVGKTLNFTGTAAVTTPDGYGPVAAGNPTAVFVEDRTDQEVVFLYRQNENNRYVNITVKLTCDDEVFETYTVSAIKGQTTRVSRPSWTGYKPVENDPNYYDKTPTDNSTEVEFKYTIDNPRTVNVVLHDDTGNKNLSKPTGYTDSYKLKAGDSVDIQAPHIAGFDPVSAELSNTTDTGAVKSSQLVTVSYDKLQGDATVTFHYKPKSTTSFVTHTIRFVVGTHELYKQEKLIPKGTGAGEKVEYKEDDVKYTVPGYAFDDISYAVDGKNNPTEDDVTNVVNATITYHFVEDAAQIVINQKCTGGGDGTPANPEHNQTKTLTGYRKGQKNVVVMAPVLSGHALKNDADMMNSFDELAAGDNTWNIDYVLEGNSSFTLRELDGTTDLNGKEGRIIAVLNADGSKDYDAKAANGNPLDLTALGYTYKPYAEATDPFKPNGTGKVEKAELSTPKKYTVYYEKNTRNVQFYAINANLYPKPTDMTQVDLNEAKRLNAVINGGGNGELLQGEEARVGETYKAVARSFDGYALQDDFTYSVQVATGTEALNVYFWYVPRTTGTVTVRYASGTSDTDPGTTLNEYSFKSVSGEKVTLSPPEYILDGKYKRRNGEAESFGLTVGTAPVQKTFYYEPNFVTVTVQTVTDDGTASPYATHEVNKTDGSGQQTTNNLTLTPPNKAGYTLVGIDATGATLTNGGADKLPTQYANNQLALTGLTQDATVTYYYKTTKASEYQTALTVEYKYNGYDLAAPKPIKANTDDANSIDIPAFDGYKATTYSFTDGTTAAPSTGGITDGSTAVSVTPTKQTATLTITYVRPDGSVVLPGGDNQIPAPDDKDNVTVTPDHAGNIAPQPDGSVKVETTGGTVNRPKDPAHPDQGKENIKVPEGTIVKPDGTIILPDGGGTINPDGKLPGATPADYISVVYKANGGTGDDVIDLIKNDQTIKARANAFTNGNQTFTGWNTVSNGVGGTLYQATDTITVPAGEKSVTLYAQWGKANFAHSTMITYLPNDGTGETYKVVDTVGSNTSANFKANLRDTNPFSVTGWTFGGWHTESNGVGGELKQLGAEIDAAENAPQTWYAQWYKVNADDSITVPGEDGNPNTSDNNVTANGNGTKNPERKDTGEVDIPAGGNVVKGNETIALPDGGTLKPDGTLIINKPNNGGQIEVKPDGTTDDTNVVTLTYRANDGTDKHTTVYATKGADIAPLAADTFSYSGHRFLYWQSGNDTYTAAAGTITPTEAMTLFAVWAKFNPDGSMELPGQDGKLPAPNHGDNVTVTPDKPNGTLDGPKNDGSVEVKDDGATVTRPDPQNPDKKEDIKVPEGTIVKPDGTIVLPEPKPGGTTINPGEKFPDTTTDYVTVTLLAGTGTGNTIKKVVKTGSAVILTDENRFTAPAGEFLVGWLDSNGRFFDPDDSYTANTAETFTAQYKANAELTKAVAVFDYAGGVDTQGNGSKSITGKATTAIPNSDVTTPTRDGYTFNGWDKTLNFGEIGTVTVFTAQWSKQTYTVTFEEGTDGTMTGDPAAQVDYNGSVPADKIPDVTANAGKVFIGWLNSGDNSVYTAASLANYKVTDNVTFTAQYADDSNAIVIFDYDGGTADGKYSSYRTGTPGSKIVDTGAIPTPTRPGFTFNDWDQTIDENTEFGTAGTVTVYKAGWNPDTKQIFTVTFDIDATKGSTNDTTTEQVEDGSFVTNVPTVTAIPGYSFVGWKDPNDKLFYEAGIQHYRITGETTFTAEFVEISVTPDKATVIFDANGGRIGGSSVLTKDGIPGTVIGVPAEPVRPGYTFVGWSDGFDATTTYGAKGTSVTYTAQWQAIAYTIHFSATGASGATADQTYQFDGTTSNTLNRNGFSMSGKRFLGWSLTDGASTADYADGALINTTLQNAMANSNGSITLYAVWKDNGSGGGGSSGGGGGGGSSTVSSYTIKASAGNGGNISPSGNVTVKRGEDQSFHINPINGYRISDVIVDGKSVGAVSTYTFDSVKANHTIQVKFVKYNSIVADPEVTGVAGWLQTKEHNGYMGGYGNGLFGPNDNMTRAQAARMFYNLLLEKDVPVTVSFTDVPADAWYAEAVNTLASLGVIKGIGDGQFAPNRTITRAEFTVIAMRFANVSADVTNPFTDIATNDWYYTAVTSAVSYGWINGYSDGSFRPQATITRAEVVTIVNRMLNRTADRNFVDSNVTAQFDDVPNTYWAYYNIMEATIAHDHSIDNDGVESWGKQK